MSSANSVRADVVLWCAARRVEQLSLPEMILPWVAPGPTRDAAVGLLGSAVASLVGIGLADVIRSQAGAVRSRRSPPAARTPFTMAVLRDPDEWRFADQSGEAWYVVPTDEGEERVAAWTPQAVPLDAPGFADDALPSADRIAESIHEWFHFEGSDEWLDLSTLYCMASIGPVNRLAASERLTAALQVVLARGKAALFVADGWRSGRSNSRAGLEALSVLSACDQLPWELDAGDAVLLVRELK